jgi:hypothetical protein
VILSLIIPVIGFVVLDLGSPSQSWTSIRIHAILETIGLTVGLITPLFLLPTNPEEQEVRSLFDWIAAALIGMGVLNGFHEAVLPGDYCQPIASHCCLSFSVCLLCTRCIVS